MLTWAPVGGTGRKARPATVMRSQLVGPGGTRSGCMLLVIWTASVAWPAAVVIRTCITGGPDAKLASNAALMVRGSTAASNFSWIHWPTGPTQLPDSHRVNTFPSNAAYGSRPLDHWPGIAATSDAEDDAVTSAMPA